MDARRWVKREMTDSHVLELTAAEVVEQFRGEPPEAFMPRSATSRGRPMVTSDGVAYADLWPWHSDHGDDEEVTYGR